MTFLPPELVAVVGVPVVVMTRLFTPIPLYLPADGGGTASQGFRNLTKTFSFF